MVSVPEDDINRIAEMDAQFNTLLVRKIPATERKKRKVDEAGSSCAAASLGEAGDADDKGDTPPSQS